MRKPISRNIVVIQQVAIVMLFSILLVHAVPTSNFNQNKTDQTRRSSARIDPVTLGLNIEIPLGFYPGRNGTNIPLTINYSSKLWTTDTAPGFQSPCLDFDPPCINGINRPDQTIAVFANDSMAGWTSSLKVPKVVYTGKFQPFQQDGSPSCLDCGGIYIQRMHIYLPDGSTHELRKSDAGNNTDWSGTYYAVDGSQMRYETENKTLFLPDGARYIIYGALLGNDNSLVGNSLAQNIYDNYRLTQPAEYIDRNGNKLTYAPATKKWTDTLGREFGSPFPADVMDPPGYQHTPNRAAEGDIIYSLPGMGTGTIQYTFKWKKLSDVFSNPNYQVHYPGSQSSNRHDPPLSPALFQNTASRGMFNPVVLAEIVFPNNTSYKFGYNPYGEIDKLTHPTGAYEKFTYSSIIPINWQSNYDTAFDITELNLNRGVTEYSISAKGDGTDEITTQYAAGFANANIPFQLPYKSTVTNPDGTITERLIYAEDDNFIKYGFDAVPSGNVYEERLRRGSTILRRTLTDWTLSGPQTGGLSTATRDPRIIKQTEILFEGTQALTRTSTFQHDQYENVTSASDYDFVVVNPTTAETATISQLVSGALLKTGETDYAADSVYINQQLVSLPRFTRIKNAAGTVVAQSEIRYDETSRPVISAGTATNWQDPNTSYRANATNVRDWDSSTNLWIETRAQYDNFGNLRKSWDGRGKLTETEFSSTYNYAYPTKAISPIPDSTGQNGSATAFETSTQYDFNTGLPLSVIGINGQTTQMEYADALLRPTKVTAPNGHQTITEYGDSPVNLFVKNKSQIDAVNWAEGYSYFDGIGRTVKTKSKDSQGDVFNETEYDQMGRVKRVTNPYRSGETKQWTESFYDDLSRVVKVKTPDTAQANSEVNSAYSLATAGNQIGAVITVTDQAGKPRRSIVNSLGQLFRVDEPNDAGSLGTIANPVQPSFYAYDTLNNLTGVQQGVQTRTFAYDSLSRLRQAQNPESGLIQYGYDENGNLLTRTDARNITTTFAYDALNRVKTKTYSDSTPAASYFYDNLQNAKGALIKISSGVSTTEYTAFDNLGRILNHKQTTGGNGYTTGYVYNLAGAVVEQSYPNGRIVKNVLDADGDLSIVQSRKNANSGFWNYADSFTYTAAGAVSSMQLGNGRWESTQFNNRLQPTQIALGTVQNAADKLKLNYDYGTTDNNGNVKSQTITVPTVGQSQGFTATQIYSYDSLNRLKTAAETVSNQQTWKQTFDYDQYGNRRFNTTNNNTTTPDANCSAQVCNPQINPQNNRLVGYTFDDAGNTTVDAEGKTFAYDGENKQTEVRNASNQLIGTYVYDGAGKRVKKIADGETTIFVYDAAGKLIAEYSNQTQSDPPQVAYLTNDKLGTPRINTDASGNIISRHDYLPFGEELTTAQRTAILGYAADDINQKFTGKERDEETQLDYFEARYFASRIGRFTSADPLQASANTAEPQTWNRYGYVDNNPFLYVDDNGKIKRNADGTVYYKEDKISWLEAPAVNAKGEKGIVKTKEIQYAILRTDNNRIVYGYTNDENITNPDDRFQTNCFGLAFADGEFWIDDEKSIRNILEDEYTDISTQGIKPEVGDIAIYADPVSKEIIHAAVVTEVDSHTGAVKVSGINGINSESTTTTPTEQPGAAGAKPTYYRDNKANEEDRKKERRRRARRARNFKKKTAKDREKERGKPVKEKNKK